MLARDFYILKIINSKNLSNFIQFIQFNHKITTVSLLIEYFRFISNSNYLLHLILLFPNIFFYK